MCTFKFNSWLSYQPLCCSTGKADKKKSKFKSSLHISHFRLQNIENDADSAPRSGVQKSITASQQAASIECSDRERASERVSE